MATFIDGFLYNHTNVRYYNISSRVDFQDVGLKNPGHCEYLKKKKKKEKLCHRSSAYIFQWILKVLQINVGYDNISRNSTFRFLGLSSR